MQLGEITLSQVAVFIGILTTILGVFAPTLLKYKAIVEGVKCLLRSQMTNIYYRHKDEKKIRQYEWENFAFLYKAYKALGGNSFIDEIFEVVKTWEIVT